MKLLKNWFTGAAMIALGVVALILSVPFMIVNAVAKAFRVPALAGQRGNLAIGNMTGLLVAVIFLVIAITLQKDIVNAVKAVLDITDLATDFPLLATINPYLPVIYVVAVMAITGGIAYFSLRPGKS